MEIHSLRHRGGNFPMKILFTLCVFSILFFALLHATPDKSSIQARYEKAKLNRISLRKKMKQLPFAQQSALWTDYVALQLAPVWYGTLWDFNGTSEIPQEGAIACGYFVTTILRDAGYPIQRVKLAQCSSEQMIRQLTTQRAYFNQVSFEEFIRAMLSKGKSLSIIGLDNHTGFLYGDGKKLWFIHSSFVGTGRVCSEDASQCGILKGSAYKVVGFISQDTQFIKRWMTGN